MGRRIRQSARTSAERAEESWLSSGTAEPSAANPGADIGLARAIGRQAGAERRGGQAGIGPRALQPVQGRLEHQPRHHQGRDRVARQAQAGQAAQPAEPGRLARPDRDPLEGEPAAARREDGTQMVMIPHRGTADGDQQVQPLRPVQVVPDAPGRVARNAQTDGDAAPACHPPGQGA